MACIFKWMIFLACIRRSWSFTTEFPLNGVTPLATIVEAFPRAVLYHVSFPQCMDECAKTTHCSDVTYLRRLNMCIVLGRGPHEETTLLGGVGGIYASKDSGDVSHLTCLSKNSICIINIIYDNM